MKKQFLFFVLLALLSVMTLNGCGIFHLRGEIPDYEKQSYSCRDSSQIKSIVVDNNDIPVEIRNSENDDIYFLYYLANDESNQYEIVEDRGVLNVLNKCKPNYGIYILGDKCSSDSYKDVKLEIFIPCAYSGSLFVKTLDENISVYDISIKNLEIETRDGDVFFENTDITERLYCKTEDGDIKGTLAGKLSEYSLKTKSSDNERDIASGAAPNKSVEFKTDDGNVTVSFSEK